MIKDSGQRRVFDTGAKRDIDRGKGRPSLISTIAGYRKAIHLAEGAKKYTDRNWELGMPLSTFLDSAQRHLWALMDGMDDEDHAAALAFNADAYMHTEALIQNGELPPELDDLPRKKILRYFLTPEPSPPTNKQTTDSAPQTCKICPYCDVVVQTLDGPDQPCPNCGKEI